MRKIALEEHFTTPDLSRHAKGPGSSMDRKGFGRFESRLVEFDGMRLEAMDKAGIDLAVLSVTTPGVQAEVDTAVAIKRAHEANDFLAKEIQKHPTRYAGFAHLPLQDPKVAGDELARCVADLGFKGAMINGHTNGHYHLGATFVTQDLERDLLAMTIDSEIHEALGRPQIAKNNHVQEGRR